MSWAEHGLTSYPQYFESKHWHDIKEQYLDNKEAKCWICHKWTQLLLHHVDYGALYQEKLNEDVYILCFECHTKVHFWISRVNKVPLSTNALLFSMRLRRSIFCVQNRQFILALAWFMTAILIGSTYLLIWIISKILKQVLVSTSKLFLRYD